MYIDKANGAPVLDDGCVVRPWHVHGLDRHHVAGYADFGPIETSLGYNPIRFSVVFAMNMQMSYLTPPFVGGFRIQKLQTLELES